MISLFNRRKSIGAFVLRVPSYCVPCEESETLAPKRESQLEWMRERGVRYLGNPQERVEKKTLAAIPRNAAQRVVDLRAVR